jgi:dihydrofolate reductase
MRKLVANEFLSLDGVMQAPGSPQEDPSGGFKHGGWQIGYFDDGMLAAAQEGMGETDAYLFGRRTYEVMAAYWPTTPPDDPFGSHLNPTRKYVASRTLKDLAWQNSTLLDGDVPSAVRALKEQDGGTISVLGSGELMRTLLAHDLVDELGLIISPLVLGGGKRLFDEDGQLRRFELVRSTTTEKGNVLASYRLAR